MTVLCLVIMFHARSRIASNQHVKQPFPCLDQSRRAADWLTSSSICECITGQVVIRMRAACPAVGRRPLFTTPCRVAVGVAADTEQSQRVSVRVRLDMWSLDTQALDMSSEMQQLPAHQCQSADLHWPHAVPTGPPEKEQIQAIVHLLSGSQSHDPTHRTHMGHSSAAPTWGPAPSAQLPQSPVSVPSPTQKGPSGGLPAGTRSRRPRRGR